MQKQLTTIAIPVASLFLFSCSGGSLAELSRILIENNSTAVAVPDFTRGNWNKIKGFRHAFLD